MWPFKKSTKRRVLIVDDDVNTRTMIGMFFEECGWDVREASNGQLGVDAATADPPDLIVLDCDMPVMTGPDALVLLHGNPKTTAVPVLMVTARGTLDDVEACLSRGARDFVQKPLDLKRFMEKVDKIVPPPKP
ncbi:response regulator [bacterium]|nr:MAG: response regulator [bacterium]